MSEMEGPGPTQVPGSAGEGGMRAPGCRDLSRVFCDVLLGSPGVCSCRREGRGSEKGGTKVRTEGYL